MSHLDSLTLQEKIMNMAELGTVLRSLTIRTLTGNPHQQRVSGWLPYTLCEYQGKARRNRSRHGAVRLMP